MQGTDIYLQGYSPIPTTYALSLSKSSGYAQVLDAKGSSYASDVYSFGIVAWEVLSRQVPWAGEALARDIYRRVVFKGDRPEMPADAPDDIADIVRRCWAGTPRKRLTAIQINGRLRYFGLQEED